MKRVALGDILTERVFHNPEIAKQVMLRPGDVPHLTQFAQALQSRLRERVGDDRVVVVRRSEHQAARTHRRSQSAA